MRAVHSLGPVGSDFVVVSKGEATYLQARICRPGFILEHQDGPESGRFQTPPHIPYADLGPAFNAYASGDDLWKEMFLWEKLDSTRSAPVDAGTSYRVRSGVHSPITVFEALKILEVSPDVTLDALRVAYRTKIRKCHPDHVQTLDDDFKDLAEEKSKLLNEAYRLLLHRFDGR